jgi:hypothetical protein
MDLDGLATWLISCIRSAPPVQDNSAFALPLPGGVGCVLGPSHFGQRPRVDGTLIDEMSSWDEPRQVMIEFRV